MKIRANGKLLITGEYFVMRGAKALAVPTTLGQTMDVSTSSGSEVNWKAIDSDGEVWFHAKLDLFNFQIEKTSDDDRAEKLRELIKIASRQNSDFLSQWKKYKVKTKLEFPLEWGLGTSSALVYLISEWAELNPFELYFDVFEGSGYDVACAYADGPILYELTDESIELEDVDFNPTFKDKIYFVYSGQKQRTEDSIAAHRKNIDKFSQKDIAIISSYTEDLLNAKTLDDFCTVIQKHEEFVGKALNQTPVQQERFADFEGVIKSLGAWGGDFYMVVSKLPKDKIQQYFMSKSVGPVLSFDEIVLQPKPE